MQPKLAFRMRRSAPDIGATEYEHPTPKRIPLVNRVVQPAMQANTPGHLSRLSPILRPGWNDQQSEFLWNYQVRRVGARPIVLWGPVGFMKLFADGKHRRSKLFSTSASSPSSVQSEYGATQGSQALPPPQVLPGRIIRDSDPGHATDSDGRLAK